MIKLSLFLQNPSSFDISKFDIGTCTGLISAILKEGNGKEHLEKLYVQVGKSYSELNLSVDIREQEKMISIAEKLGFKVAYLNAGDLTSNIVGFERKGSDLFPSVFSERIFQQLHEIRENYTYSYLVVDRSFDDVIADALTSNITVKNVMATIASFILNGFPPLFMGSMMASADLVREICLKAGDGKERDGYQTYTPVRRKATKGERAFMVVASLPGVSDVIAKRLLEKFRSVENIFKASAEELEQVEGIGKKKSAEIVDVIRTEMTVEE